jgi:hypothetical protein
MDVVKKRTLYYDNPLPAFRWVGIEVLRRFFHLFAANAKERAAID